MEESAPQGTETIIPEPEKTYIISFDELKASQEALQHKENGDRTLLTQFFNPDASTLTSKLLQWAGLGFPDGHVLFSIDLHVPPVCLDGTSRTAFLYIQYLTGNDVGYFLRILETKLPGMLLSYSTPNSTIRIHVSKG
jgi:hypothetical protein